MISASDILAKEILNALFFDDPRTWRYRQVTQITPLVDQSYRARTSYQFKINRSLISARWRGLFGDEGPRPPRRDIPLIIPIDYLPKYVLLDFSLEDSAGKPLALLSSGDINQLSMEIVRTAMMLLDQRCADGVHSAQDFFEQNERIIFALIATGQGEIATRLRSVGAFQVQPNSEFEYGQSMTRFYSEAFNQFGNNEIPAQLIDPLWSQFRAIYATIEQAGGELKLLLSGGLGYADPLLNPALLITEWLKSSAGEGPLGPALLADRTNQFLGLAYQFLGDVLGLTNDDKRFFPILGVLSRLSRYYVAYARVDVPQDRDFIIKMEQIIPAGQDWSWRHPWRAIRYRNFQWYPLKIGDTRSTHIEVGCEHPIELEQIPGGSRVRWSDRVVKATSVFGRGSYETRYHQHFYTNRRAEAIAHAIGAGKHAQRPQYMYDFELGIRYAVEGSTAWGYRLIALIVLTALMYLVASYNPARMRNNQISFLPIVPILFALFGALASLRPQEGIVAIRMRKYKSAVLLMAGTMALYFGIGIASPELITWARGMIAAAGLEKFLF